MLPRKAAYPGEGADRLGLPPRPPGAAAGQPVLDTVTLPPRFLGRRKELRALKGDLRRGRRRQLLITGPGGQGKTALAGKLA